MLSFTKSLVLASLALSVASLATPHDVRSVHRHRAIAVAQAGVAPEEPIIVSQSQPARRTSRKRRSQTKKCRPRPSSSVASVSATGSPSGQSLPVISTTAAATTTSSSSTHTSSTKAAAPTTTTKDAPAPTTSTKDTPAPTTTAKKAAPTATTTSAPPATTSASSGGGDVPSYLAGTNTGQGTFYGTGLGACGITNSDSDYIAAVSEKLFDSFPNYNGANPNSNPVCNKKVTATYQGKSVSVTITDRCTACAITDLDFSPAAFQQLASESVGRISGMTWKFD